MTIRIRRSFVWSFAVMLVAPAAVDAYAAPPLSARTAVHPMFESHGDRPHLSSTAWHATPRRYEIVAKAWWNAVNGPATHARVTVRLQQRRSGRWRDAGRRGSAVLRSHRQGRYGKAVAVAPCAPRGEARYRSVIDVDIIGHDDTPDKLYRGPHDVTCWQAPRRR